MEIDVKVKAELILPEVPNALELNNGTHVSTSDLGIRVLRKLGKEWTEALIAESRREDS